MITRSDIHNHVILPAIGTEFNTATVEIIEDAVLEAAPLDTWSWTGAEYVSAAIDENEFWAIVAKAAQ